MTYIQVDMPEALWEKYKILVNRELTLEESLIQLVKRAVDDNKEIRKDASKNESKTEQ
jgi:hypothetical protein